MPCQEFGPAFCAAGRGSNHQHRSVSAHLPLSRVVAYSAAEAAVLNMTQFLAREWAPYGVRVNTITPAFSPRSRTESCSSTKTARQRRARGLDPRAHGDGPLWQSHELAGAAVFLAARQPAVLSRHGHPRRWRFLSKRYEPRIPDRAARGTLTEEKNPLRHRRRLRGKEWRVRKKKVLLTFRLDPHSAGRAGLQGALPTHRRRVCRGRCDGGSRGRIRNDAGGDLPAARAFAGGTGARISKAAIPQP